MKSFFTTKIKALISSQQKYKNKGVFILQNKWKPYELVFFFFIFFCKFISFFIYFNCLLHEQKSWSGCFFEHICFVVHCFFSVCFISIRVFGVLPFQYVSPKKPRSGRASSRATKKHINHRINSILLNSNQVTILNKNKRWLHMTIFHPNEKKSKQKYITKFTPFAGIEKYQWLRTVIKYNARSATRLLFEWK